MWLLHLWMLHWTFLHQKINDILKIFAAFSIWLKEIINKTHCHNFFNGCYPLLYCFDDVYFKIILVLCRLKQQSCYNFKYSGLLPQFWFLSQPEHHRVKASEQSVRAKFFMILVKHWAICMIFPHRTASIILWWCDSVINSP